MKVIFIISTLLITNSSFAQTDSLPLRQKKNSLFFEYGFLHNRLIDEGYTDSKLLFYGTNSKLRIGYTRETVAYIFNFIAEGGSGKVTSKHDHLPSELSHVRVAFEYFRHLKAYRLFGKETALFAGINCSGRVYVLENTHVLDNMSLFSMQGVYLGVLARVKIDPKRRLEVAYLLPAVVSVGRILNSESNFSHSEQTQPVAFLLDNSETIYFNVFRLVQLRVNYEKDISRHTSFTARYGFFYAHSAFKAPVSLYSNELLFGLKFRF